MKKTNFFAMVFVIFCLSLTVGYALFSETIEINGTATAKGTFDVVFKNAIVKTEVGSTEASAVVSDDGNTLTLAVPKLEYPGAYVEFTVDAVNEGTIPAVLKGITETGLTANPNIKITYSGVTKDEQMNQSNFRTITIKVEWLYESEEAAKDIEFSIKLDYQQITS